MDIELLQRDLKVVESSLDNFLSDGMTKVNWFVSFGSLLYLIRDKKHNVPYNTDVDISIIGEHRHANTERYLLENGFTKNMEVCHDKTGQTLFASYISKNDLHIDLFYWLKVGSNYWHTYDYMGDARNGIPGKYHFKSAPCYMFDGGTVKYKWFEDMAPVKIPLLYGTLLDYWYPGWFVPDPDFGVSKAERIIELNSCGNLEEDLNAN